MRIFTHPGPKDSPFPSFSCIFHKFNKSLRLIYLDGFRKISPKNIIIQALPKPTKYKYEGLQFYDKSDLYGYFELH